MIRAYYLGASCGENRKSGFEREGWEAIPSSTPTLHSLLHALQFNADQLQAYSGLMKRHSGYKQLVDPQLKAFETYEVLTVIQSE
ncbi:MAG: hypothetical protein EBE86_006590 [Hormoscilla sp. GUM202]|nr:hypothetical protein [Hormoscilla sp. GUM202]